MSIVLDKVSCVYDEGTANERYALKCVSTQIEPGEFIGVIGHTGSGKSTLMQVLNGLIVPSGGHVYYNGEDIHQKGYNLFKLRSKVGIVFQYPEHQLFESTVFKDVCFGPKNLGWSKKEIELAAFEALYQLGIEPEVYYQSPFDLSGGQKRRVAIAGVLAMKPDLLILDEPTAGLDPKGRQDILDKIAQLRQERGCGIILVSHSMEDVADYVDRVWVLDDGKLEMDAPVKEVFTDIEKMEQMQLALPQVTYLMHRLKESGILVNTNITTIQEAKEEILRKLR